MESTNKIALVTGGSRGLGKNEALTLAKHGHHVIITYNSRKDEADKVVAEIEGLGRKAAALQLNAGEAKTFEAFKGRLTEVLKSVFNTERFDFLINNAGIDWAAPFEQTTEEQLDTLYNIHFKGVFLLSQTLSPIINDGGRIVNTSTGLARFTTPGYAAYASMKGAIETLTKYMAKELGKRKINVNMVAPGIIETDFTAAAREHEGLVEYISSQTALGRIGQPDDIGGVVAFLCSDDARWVTAQRVEASGGMFL
ncbi:SDR family NAD(P)-dependent oxidoreductase [Mucilaginibacter sp. KACC 22063]|uniref:SDR family NAD(P)-dependent oxidoreductase n=1 Tax=Mucilaginibacter sp. KACC 22063 TaxID=3025666 RepID=UPI0023657769|nr:SDR family oxidoreductase [Mucilaginibacter sp. KACC 22063]WDF56476.1 SDR family oxidoreductase [Mucilaginibacter sp. KACC 22063]